MNKEQLDYVVGQLNSGVDKETLRQSLRDNNYEEAAIEELLAAAEQGDQSASTVPDPSGAGFSVFQSIGDGFAVALKRLDLFGWSFLLQAVIFAFIVALMVGFFALNSGGEMSNLAGMLVLVLVSLVAISVLGVLNMGAILKALVSDEEVTYWQGFAWTWKNFWAFFLVSILVSLVTITGTMLLIVPGIILAVYLLFAQYAFANEGVRGLNALARSRQLAAGHWWKLAGTLFMVGLISFFGTFIIELVAGASTLFSTGDSLTVTISDILTIPLDTFLTVFTFAVMASIYRRLAVKAGPYNEAEMVSKKKTYKIMAWLSPLILVLGVLLTVVLASLNSSSEKAYDASSKINLMNTRMEAELYYDANGMSYEGFCSQMIDMDDMAVDCVDSPDGVAVMTMLNSGEFYCVDTNDFSDVPELPIFDDSSCYIGE